MGQRSILVTGGAGFIGSHTCKRLHAEGFLPIAYDNLSTGHERAVRWGPLIEADIADTAASPQPASAIARMRSSILRPRPTSESRRPIRKNTIRTTSCGMLSVLRACRLVGIRIVVFSSSCAVYGDARNTPIDESAPLAPISPYGRTKLIGEQILQDYAEAYGLRYAALRYFNACGADPDGELGEWHDPETHLIPRALLAAAGRLQCLEVYGDDYPTPDGTCVRDFIHVSDLARAHVLALRRLLAGSGVLRVNLGAGRGSSVKEVISAIERGAGRRVPLAVKPRRPGDPAVVFAETSLARKTLGFVPELLRSGDNRSHIGADVWTGCASRC